MMLESPDALCELSLPVTEATDCWLKCFVRVSVKVRGLEDWLLGQQQRNNLASLWVIATLWVPLGSAELVG